MSSRAVFSVRVALLLFGVFACSTAALLIKESQTHPVLIAAWRLLLASVVLQPVFWTVRRRYPEIPLRRILSIAWPAAALLAGHFWTWNMGVHGTRIAHASLIVNMTAPVMPIIVWMMLRERATGRELLGTTVAFIGAVVLCGADFRFERELFVGDVICFVSMLAFALYLVWSRRSRTLPNLWLYVPPVYLMAGLMCLAAGCAVEGNPLPASPREWAFMVGLAAIPTILGHTILNYSMQALPSQLVAVCSMGQFVPAAALAWAIFRERPTLQFAVATVFVVCGALVVIHGHAPAEPASLDE